MKMMIHCPACHTRLKVAQKAADHIIRCLKCKNTFRVPRPNEMVEDTIACWLEMDIEHEEEQTKKLLNETDPELTLDPETFSETPLPSIEDIPEYESSDDLLAADLPSGNETATAEAEKPSPEPSDEPDATEDENQPQEAEPTTDDTETVEVPDETPAPAATQHFDISTLTDNEGLVRMFVVDASPAGATIAFEPRHLEREAFRASFPMKCATCGQTDREVLTARPFVWSNELQGHRLVQEVESACEIRVKKGQTPADIVELMPAIEGMSTPFSNPLPYYLCEPCTHKALINCHTELRDEVCLCQVSLDRGGIALEWLGRVNGVCNDDYAQMEQAVNYVAEDTAWLEVPDQIRQRLAGWFQYDKDEQFQVYVKDSDYSKADAGLGGVVLTDKRFVFCKYHKHGDFKLDDDGIKIVAVRSGPFDELSAVRNDHQVKLVRLRPNDTWTLIERLETLHAAVRVERG